MHEPETPRTWLCAGGIEPMTFGGRNDFLYIPCPRSAVYFPMLIPICETSIHRKNLRCPATYPLAPLGARPVCHDEASKYGAMKRFTPKSHNPCYFGYRTSVKVAILFACTGFRKLGVSTPMDLDTFYAVRRPGSETRKRLHIDREVRPIVFSWVYCDFNFFHVDICLLTAVLVSLNIHKRPRNFRIKYCPPLNVLATRKRPIIPN